MEKLIKDDAGILSTTLTNVGGKLYPIDTCYNKKDFPDVKISEEDIKNPKFKVGNILCHYNNLAYPFRIFKVNYDKRTCEIVAYGNNYVETVNGDISEVSFDIIDKEFEISTIPTYKYL